VPVYKRGEYWHVSVSYRGQRLRKTAGRGATRREAKELEAQALADLRAIAAGKAPTTPLSDALLRWLDNECKQLKAPHKYESHARALLPYIKGKRLTDVLLVSEDVKRGMLREGLSPATTNRRVAILRRIANLAHKQWGLLDEPLGEKITLLRENNARHVYLTPAQVETIAKACPNPDAGDMVRLAAYTGLRRSELFRLTADSYRNGCIVLDGNTKSGKPRIVPVPREAVVIVERLPLPLTDSALRDAWDAAREATGMSHVRFHDLRHTYASWLVQAGAPMRAVQELLGHTTITMTQRYSHLSPAHLIDAVETMRKHIKKTAGHKRDTKQAARTHKKRA
jgi:integrase